MRLQRARAVVTGGASGLGLAVVERLVELGARVVVLDLRPPVALPPGAAYVEADVGSEAAAQEVRRSAAEQRGYAVLFRGGGPVGAWGVKNTLCDPVARRWACPQSTESLGWP